MEPSSAALPNSRSNVQFSREPQLAGDHSAWWGRRDLNPGPSAARRLTRARAAHPFGRAPAASAVRPLLQARIPSWTTAPGSGAAGGLKALREEPLSAGAGDSDGATPARAALRPRTLKLCAARRVAARRTPRAVRVGISSPPRPRPPLR